MTTKFILCLMALLVMSMPIMAVRDSGSMDNAIDIGTISNQTVDLSQNGTLAYPGDIGWFTFQVAEPVDFVFSVDRYSRDFVLVLYDENMEYVDSGEGMFMLELAPGSYNLRVEAVPFEKVNYTLKGTVVWMENEPNDGIGDATDLGSITGPVAIGGETDSGADIDFFKFKIDEGKDGMFDASSYPSYTSLLALYGFNDSKKRYEIIESDTDISTYLESGEYILRLSMDTSYCYECGCQQKYLLSLELSPINATSLGVLNNESSPLNASGYIESSAEGDYYSFEVQEAVPVVIETSGEAGDSTLRLEDAKHQMLDYNDDANGRWSEVDYDLEPGKYFVVVGSYSSELSYNLTVKLGAE